MFDNHYQTLPRYRNVSVSFLSMKNDLYEVAFISI